MNQDKPRWQQRFDNYKRAYFLLQEAIETRSQTSLNQLLDGSFR